MVGGVNTAGMSRALGLKTARKTRRQPTTEAPIQAYGTKLCAKLGGITIRQHKGRGVTAGWPDCLHILPPIPGLGLSVCIWAEYKAPGCAPTILQARRHEELRKVGQEVWVCDSCEAVDIMFADVRFAQMWP